MLPCAIARKILVVDDDRATRELVAAMLEGHGWQLDSAANGPDALSKLEASAFDVILTDINMPGMDGITLLQHIREFRPATPVIIMTGENMASNVAGALRNQAFGYIAKPFTVDAVLEVVQRALGSSADPDDIEITSSLPNWISLQLRCKIATADRLVSFLREMESTLTPDDRDMVATAFRELLMNAIEHGGHFDPQKKVNVAYVRTARSIIYYLRDPGEGFSVNDLPHAAVSNAPGEPAAHVQARAMQGLRPGGFGILLTRNFADELLYSEKANEVIFIKYLDEKSK